MKTFYIASSSLPAYRKRVQRLATRLETIFGWGWHNDWNWISSFDEAEERNNEAELIQCAQNDLEGARDCDVFIYIQPHIRSIGANREYGVRWGQGLQVYRISNGMPKHLFDMVDYVTSVLDENSLIVELSKSEETRSK